MNLLTIPEAARQLGLSPSTLRTQVSTGSLRATRYGRDWLIAPSELARYERENKGRPGRKRVLTT